MIKRGNRAHPWEIDTAAVAEWLQERAVVNAIGDTSTLDMEEARRRKTAAEAALAELQLSKSRGEVISMEEVVRVVADEFARCRARLMGAAPKLAPMVSTMESIAEIKEAIEGEIIDALDEVSQYVDDSNQPDPSGDPIDP